MSDHKGLLQNSTIEKDEHDELFKAKRVSDVGNDDQILMDESVINTLYVGRAGRGVATSTPNWLLKRLAESGTSTTIQHAVDSWENRLVANYS